MFGFGCSGSTKVYLDPRKSDKILVYCSGCGELWRSEKQALDEPTPLPENLNEKYEMMYPQD